MAVCKLAVTILWVVSVGENHWELLGGEGQEWENFSNYLRVLEEGPPDAENNALFLSQGTNEFTRLYKSFHQRLERRGRGRNLTETLMPKYRYKNVHQQMMMMENIKISLCPNNSEGNTIFKTYSISVSLPCYFYIPVTVCFFFYYHGVL